MKNKLGIIKLINKLVILLIVIMTVPATHYAINPAIMNSIKKIEVSGQVLTGLGLISQETSDKNRDLLYYAGNIDIRFPASETETFYATIRIQPNQEKAGSLGLTNPKLDLPDFEIGYSADHERHFSFGSINVPFGQHMATLSDNANTFQSAFITHSLLYDAISGPVGIPKIIGVHALFTYPLETYRLAIANSSKANQNSENGNFTLVFSAHTKRLLERLTIGAAVMKADEFRDVDDGIDIGLLGIIADADYKLDWGGIKGYIASVNYDDTLGNTEGNSLSWMLETYLNTDTYRYALALSQWLPRDDDGSGGNSPLPTVGFGRLKNGDLLTIKDQAVTRIQFGVTKPIKANMELKTELFYDQYSKTDSNTFSLLSFINIDIQGTKKVTPHDTRN